MKLRTILIAIGILSSLFGCKNERRSTEKQGNEIIEKDVEYVIPKENQKTGSSYKIFLRNETDQVVEVKDRFKLKPEEERIFEFVDTDSILLDNGSKIYFGDYGLEVNDKNAQLAGIGGEYWEGYIVPEDVEYGFVIVKPGEGDTTHE